MAILQPLIDERDQQKLVNQLKKLILAYCPEWEDLSSLDLDLNANALIHIFARMMEITIQRLNKVPEKNLLSFLDMVGISLAPPRVARAPLVFSMAKGASQYGFVPAGAQIASAPLKDGTSVIFETEKDLTVILPKLVKAISLNPKTDYWKDHSPAFFNKSPNQNAEELFQGKDLVSHQLWLGSQKLFGLKEPANIILNITLGNDNLRQLAATKWQVKWYCYTDGIKTPLVAEEENSDPDIVNLLKTGQITFLKLSGISAQTITGMEASEVRSWTNQWIVAELNRPITDNVKDNLPEIKNITAAVKIDGRGHTGTGTIASQGLDLIKGTKTSFNEELKEKVERKENVRIIAKNQKRKVT
ncbi:MAG TPA: hypothetical protein VHY08_19305, partial [Bacillota bacterium]|nr:hypothetical protein [Bacillota bacterium]